MTGTSGKPQTQSVRPRGAKASPTPLPERCAKRRLPLRPAGTLSGWSAPGFHTVTVPHARTTRHVVLFAPHVFLARTAAAGCTITPSDLALTHRPLLKGAGPGGSSVRFPT